MGNHKLRLSSIIPNTWFHKLKQMGFIAATKSPRNRPLPITTTYPLSRSKRGLGDPDVRIPSQKKREDVSDNSPSLPRKSYHISRKKRPSKKTNSASSSSSVSAACSCGSTATAKPAIRFAKPGSPTTSPDQFMHSFDRMLAYSSAASPVPDYEEDDCGDVVIGVDKMSLRCKTGHRKFSELVKEIGEADEETVLIVDKPRKSSLKYRDDLQSKSPVRRVFSGSASPRVRVRFNSPKLAKRVENGGGRKSASRSNRRKKSASTESMAVVKASSDPERDFKESMIEMIVENEMRESKELEELLASYLSLNSKEYHHLIVNVFQQIWFDLHHIY